MLSKEKTTTRAKAVKRAYEENLTSQECLERLGAEAAEKAAKVTKMRQPQKKTSAPAVRLFDREISMCSTLLQEDNILDSDNEVFQKVTICQREKPVFSI